MAPKIKPTPKPSVAVAPSAHPPPETAHDIAALAQPKPVETGPVEAPDDVGVLAVPGPDAFARSSPVLVTPTAVKEATDVIIASAASKPPPVSAPKETIDGLANRAADTIVKGAPGAASSKPGAGTIPPASTAANGPMRTTAKPPAVTAADMKPTNEQIVTTRSVLLRRIKKYQQVFHKETEDIIPSNYSVLDNDKLGAICAACDSSLGDCFSKDAVAVAVYTVLQSIESLALPYIPDGEQYVGVTHVAEQLASIDGSPLSRAMDRVAIKYMGRFETSAELALVIGIWSVFSETKRLNATRPQSQRSESRAISTDDL